MLPSDDRGSVSVEYVAVLVVFSIPSSGEKFVRVATLRGTEHRHHIRIFSLIALNFRAFQWRVVTLRLRLSPRLHSLLMPCSALV